MVRITGHMRSSPSVSNVSAIPLLGNVFLRRKGYVFQHLNGILILQDELKESGGLRFQPLQGEKIFVKGVRSSWSK